MNPDHAVFVDIIAERLGQARRPWACDEVTLRGIQHTLTLETRTVTLLCAEDPVGLRQFDELAAMARNHHGRLDPFTPASALACFSRPSDALNMAMEMQRDVERCQIALVTGSCIFAKFMLDGRSTCMVFGSGVAKAEDAVRHVVNGAIHVSPETYPLLEEHFESSSFDGLLFAEFADDHLLEASITMPPGACSEMSTFAGLGLTSPA